MVEPTPRNWWQRNWKWVVPVGCVGALAVAAAVVVGILVLVSAAMRSSDAYRQAVERAEADPRVDTALGSPLEPGLLSRGSVRVEGPTGEASLAIPLSGPGAEGTLYVEATKRAGRWQFDLLELEVKGRVDRIDLLEPASPAAPGSPPS